MSRISSVFDLHLKVSSFVGFYTRDGHSRKSYTYFFTSVFLVNVPFITIQFITLCKIERDINIFASSFYLFVTNFNVIFKACVFFLRSNSIKAILKDLDTTMYHPHSSIDVRENLKQVKNVSIFCTIIIVLTEVLICGYPLLSNEKILPVPIWLPFDYTEDYVYVICYSC